MFKTNISSVYVKKLRGLIEKILIITFILPNEKLLSYLLFSKQTLNSLREFKRKLGAGFFVFAGSF